ncbi:hypothetical protein C8Q78DRAFT_952332, partial [Trametes maxima]
HVEIEEVVDVEAGSLPRCPWIEDFPGPAAATFGTAETTFERIQREKDERNEAPWAPFESYDEWELARWLATSGLTQADIGEFLNLKI